MYTFIAAPTHWDFTPSSTQGKSDRINLEQFVNFMNDKQRDPRLNEILYPLYEDKRAAEIITTYEQDDEAKSSSEFSQVVLMCIKHCLITIPVKIKDR